MKRLCLALLFAVIPLQATAESMRDAKLIPEADGFIIKDIREGSFYSSIGLKNGDRIVQINETKLTSSQFAIESLRELRNLKKSSKIVLFRNGEKQNLNVVAASAE